MIQDTFGRFVLLGGGVFY